MNDLMKNKIVTISLILLFISTLFGCATPYQKLGKRGGYTDKKINDHVYLVTFQGNDRTSDEVVYKYFLRRCAEIALEHHFSYFIVIESEEATKASVNVAEGSSRNKSSVTTMSYSNDTDYSPTLYKTIVKHIIEGKVALFKEGEEPLNAIKVEDVLKNVRY